MFQQIATLFLAVNCVAQTPVTFCDLLQDPQRFNRQDIVVRGFLRYGQHEGFFLSSGASCDLRGSDPRRRWVTALPLLESKSSEKLFGVDFESPTTEMKFLNELILLNIKSTLAYTTPGLVWEIDLEVRGQLQAPATYHLCCGKDQQWIGMWGDGQYKAILVYQELTPTVRLARFVPRSRR